MGGTTKLLCRPSTDRWTCLEPDRRAGPGTQPGRGARRAAPELPVVTGTLEQIPPPSLFDTLLYIDVLEHIEDDRGELEQAAAHLSPAATWSCWDRPIPGSFLPSTGPLATTGGIPGRRCLALTPAGLVMVRSIYLDSDRPAGLAGQPPILVAVDAWTRVRSPSGTRSWSVAHGWSIRYFPRTGQISPQCLETAGFGLTLLIATTGRSSSAMKALVPGGEAGMLRRAACQSSPENPKRSTHSWESKRVPNYRRFS